jgi:PKD repeat protein
MTFRAEAGVTYYFQVGNLYNQTGGLSFSLDVAPPPQAQFYFYPGDPSTFDDVQFYDNSWDPAGTGIKSQAWDFGDGTTAQGCCPFHRYAKDGDYTVKLTVTTTDGRTGSTSQVVHVKTHDVAITKLSAPQSAKAGQTRQIVVDIKNTRYPETVRVELLKSIPGGFQSIASTEQNIPVRSGNRTTAVSLSYTFTSADAAVGKVTFKSVVYITNGRDALPADNEAIASPTKVSP